VYPVSQRTEQVTLEYDFSRVEPEQNKRRSEIFEQMNESSNWFFIQKHGWHLPATLEPHEWCGTWSWRGCLNVNGHSGSECSNKVFVKTFQKSCYRADCQVCWKKWLARESNKSTKRIEKYEELSGKSVKHIVISVPKWEYGKDKKELAKWARKILKEVKADGGCMVFHPFRYNREEKFWYYSPHFHVLGFGWIEAVAQAYQKYGWIVKNLGTRDSTFATVYYQLSHAGIRKHNHVLTWFGDLSYSKLEIKNDDDLNQKCPYCFEKLIEVYSLGAYRDKPPSIDMELIAEPYEWTSDKLGDEYLYAKI